MNPDLEWLKERSELTDKSSARELYQMLDIAKGKSKFARLGIFIASVIVYVALVATAFSVLPVEIPSRYSVSASGFLSYILTYVCWIKLNSYVIRKKLLKVVNGF